MPINAEMGFASIIALIISGEISKDEAIHEIANAELQTYFDMDRLSIASSHFLTEGKDALEEHSGKPRCRLPMSSLHCGIVGIAGHSLMLSPRGFVDNHRLCMVLDDFLGLSTTTIAELGCAAGAKIQCTPAEYSFRSALAYRVELAGSRHDARQIWGDYAALDMKDWAEDQFEPLFLEIQTSEPIAPGCGLQEDIEIVRTLKAYLDHPEDTDPASLYAVAHGLALGYTEQGRLPEAIEMYSRVLNLPIVQESPVSRLLIEGDRLWAAMRMDDSKVRAHLCSHMTECLSSVPRYVGCAAIFSRSAFLCAMCGDPVAEWAFACAVSECV